MFVLLGLAAEIPYLDSWVILHKSECSAYAYSSGFASQKHGAHPWPISSSASLICCYLMSYFRSAEASTVVSFGFVASVVQETSEA